MYRLARETNLKNVFISLVYRSLFKVKTFAPEEKLSFLHICNEHLGWETNEKEHFVWDITIQRLKAVGITLVICHFSAQGCMLEVLDRLLSREN